MIEQFEQLERTGFADLQGSTGTLRLVVDQSLINAVIADAIIPSYPAVREVRVDIGPDNQVAVRVRSNALLMPDVTVHLEIERLAILEPALAVRFRIRKQGFSKVLASLLPTLAHKLPPYVTLSGEDVEVDLTTWLARWRSVLPLLVRLQFVTSPGKLHVELELRA